MPWPLRLEYPGAIYHVMILGGRGEPVFQDVSGSDFPLPHCAPTWRGKKMDDEPKQSFPASPVSTHRGGDYLTSR